MPADSATDDKPKPFLGLNGPQTIGSALAAVTSALVGSFLGVAGTLIGAALGSVIATVGAALYARTLSSAATVAMRNIPQRRKGGLPGDDEALAASAPAGNDMPQSRRARRQLTPKSWIRIGAVSAAAFVVAMIGVTAVEFGTHKPISSLVSSTSSAAGGTAAQTTTLGAAFSGSPAVPDKAAKPAADPKDVPEQVGESPKGQDTPTTGASPAPGANGSAGSQGSGTAKSNDTAPAEVAPATEPSPTPAPSTEQTAKPEASPTPAATEQPAP